MNKEGFKAGIRRRFLLIFDEVVKNKGVLDKDIAADIGIHPSSITQIRAGTANPQLEIMVTLCKKYRYDLTHLITGEKERDGKLPASNVTLEDLHQEIVELKKMITSKKR